MSIDSDTDGFRSGIDGAISKLGDFRTQVGLAGAAVGGLAAGGLMKATQAAADFDASMTESVAIMGDVSSAMRDDMAGAAREVARQTTHSAEEAADSYFYLASAGLDAQESLEAMPDVAEFAQAGMFGMEQATDLLTDSASALGLEMDNLASLGDRFVKANTLANTSVEQVAEAMTNKAAPAMDRLGVATNEGISALSVFADQGLKGRRAGTILARTLEGLDQQARKNSDAFEELGVQVFDADGEMRDMEDIIADLEGGLEGMSTQQRQAALEQLGFNQRAQQGLDLLIGNSEQLREYEGELDNAGGTAGEIADNQLDTFNKQVELLTSKLTDIGIVIGQQVLGPLTGLLKHVNAAVERFAQWNDETEGLPATLGLVSTAVGGFAVAAANLAGGLGPAVSLVGSLSVQLARILTPVGMAVTAVAGLATAWTSNFASIRSETNKLIYEVSGPFREAFTALRSTVTTVAGTFRSAWASATSGVETSIGRVVIAVRQRLGGTIRKVLTTATGHLNSFRNRWAANSTQIEGRINGLLSTIGGIASRIRSALGPAAAFVRDVFAATWTSAVSGIIETGRTLRDLVFKIGKRFGLLNDDTSTAADALGQLLDPFRKVELAVDGVEKAFNTLTKGWDEDWAGLRSTTIEATGAMREQIGGFESDSTTSFANIRTSIREKLEAGIDRVERTVADMREAWNEDFGELETTTRETFGLLDQIVNEILVPIFDRIVRTVRENLGTVNTVVDTHLGDMITEFADTLNHILDNLVNPILEAILKIWNEFGDEILTVMELAWDAIGSVVSIALDALLTTIRTVMALIRGDWGEAWDLIKGFLTRTLEEIGSFATEWGSRLLDWLGGLVGDVVQWFKDLYNDLVGGSVVPDMLADLLGAFEGWGEDLLRWLSGFVSDVVGDFEDLASDILYEITSIDLYSAGKDMVSDLISGIKAKMPSAKGAASSLASAVDRRMPGSDAETGPLSDITESGPAIPETIADGMRSQLRDVARSASDVADAARPELDTVAPEVEAPAAAPAAAAAGDQYIDVGGVEIHGDADARDVERGLSRALESRNIRR